MTALLTALTDACPGWIVWKNLDRAASGEGDVDAVAPRSEWEAATEVFAGWATGAGLGPAYACRHFPGALQLVACQPTTGRLVEVDLGARLVLRGTAYLSPDELGPLAGVGPGGVRLLRPGAEGLFLVLATLAARGGARSRASGERVRSLLAADEPGVQLAASLFGSSAAAARRCAAAVRRGGWDRRAALRWELGASVGALREPGLAAARVRFGLARRPHCPLLAALADGRRMPARADEWLELVDRTHDPL
jgi:hypothetical protein